ncbi:SMAD/FHA domain-containing protein, partial [Neoconidiobolus thromboides FSU 785]
STSTNGTPPLIPQIRFVPHNTSYARSLHFEAFSREVKNGVIIKVGRFTDKVQPSLSRIAFKSKVVSRAHAEVWTENGQFFIRDTKSSSGTFLNQQRLSPPNQESLPTPLKDGDILQLGVDYQGGVQDVFRCVRIRLEINRTWQHDQDNPFRKKALQTLDALKENLKQSGALGASTSDLEECCICLSALAPFQALFVSPCCHTFHYKCIYRLLIDGPSFVCPLCRTYADLDADV